MILCTSSITMEDDCEEVVSDQWTPSSLSLDGLTLPNSEDRSEEGVQ